MKVSSPQHQDDKAANLHGWRDLETLALDLHWSSERCSDTLWKQLAPALWEMTHNPWVVLQTASRQKVSQLLADKYWRSQIDELMQKKNQQERSAGWFQHAHPRAALTSVAYFSMEFMLSEALPIYSGGLGNVAGDQLKAANDLGVPVIAIGLLFQQGYFRQVIDSEGRQQALYPYNDPGQLPITPLRRADGEWLRLEIALPGWPMWLRTWQAQVGRVKLLLLDANDAANYPPHRGITSELYGGDSELRLKQELILGIGGWRLLEALGIQPEACHLNEGHAAFAILERARSYMMAYNVPFDIALATTRGGNIFTTHTAVAAGFDSFSPQLIARYLGDYAVRQLGIPFNQLMALGRQNPEDESENFNMAFLALNGSSAVNGVSELHGKVSRRLFSPLFPRWPEEEVPVGSVTNGVHVPSWDSEAAEVLWTGGCGEECWHGDLKDLSIAIGKIPDGELWRMRNTGRQELITYARSRLGRQLAARGLDPQDVEKVKEFFDPNVLTLGFARRFATYKRPNLLLTDPERLLRILTNPERPVQLILAGKAHPADLPGQALIEQWIHFINRAEVRPHVIFLSDYDMLLTEHMVQGVDVWLNTPQRPWEACGTSGMKVLVNGGLNLSELDGWWAEAYDPSLGWALGDGKEHDGDLSLTLAEASSLYELLENQVIPEFYTRNGEALPTSWLAKVRNSMAKLTPFFSANRAVRQYTEEYYIPAAARYLHRSADHTATGKAIASWKQELRNHWGNLRFGDIKAETTDGEHGEHSFEVQLCLGALAPSALQVEVYANARAGGSPERHPLTITPSESSSPYVLYKGSIPAKRPLEHYTPRAISFFDNVAIPLESNCILWGR